jgi:hypothetical protein
MSLIESLLGLPTPYSTLVMIAAAVIVFYIAFKVMKMILDTFIVGALSGGLYITLTYITESGFSIDNLLLFIVLGAGLYMLYSLLVKGFKTAEGILSVPYSILKKFFSVLKGGLSSLWSELKQEYESKQSSSNESSSTNSSSSSDNDDSGDDKSKKEVILDG